MNYRFKGTVSLGTRGTLIKIKPQNNKQNLSCRSLNIFSDISYEVRFIGGMRYKILWNIQKSSSPSSWRAP